MIYFVRVPRGLVGTLLMDEVIAAIEDARQESRCIGAQAGWYRFHVLRQTTCLICIDAV